MLAIVPEKLSDIYKHILSKINQNYYPETLRLFRCVYLAERPLTIAELCFTMSLPDLEMSLLESSLSELDLPTPSMMARQIISLSGGLIESKKHEKGYIVQFIHQSINDFLSREDLRILDKTFFKDSIGQGHYQLSLICANYLRIIRIDNLANSGANFLKIQFPFVDYVSRSWFIYAEKAETRGLP
jgi:hypothetical protein